MAFKLETIYAALAEWPKRHMGSEEELLARETLVLHLEGRDDVTITEEAVRVPAHPFVFPLFLSFCGLLALWASAWMPAIALGIGLIAAFNLILFFGGYSAPLEGLLASKYSANLSASKGEGDRLVILTAQLDTPVRKTEPTTGSDQSYYVWASLAAFAPAIIVPALFMSGVTIATPLMIIAVMLVTTSAIFFMTGGIRFDGAPDNRRGISAAVEAASSLWDIMPEGCTIRLLLTTGKSNGNFGARSYMDLHSDALKTYRDVIVIGFEEGQHRALSIVSEAGLLSDHRLGARGHLLVQRIKAQNDRFKHIETFSQVAGSSIHAAFVFRKRHIVVVPFLISTYGDDENALSSITEAASAAQAFVRLLPAQL